MTPLEWVRAITEPITALGAIVAAIKAWRADSKAGSTAKVIADIKSLIQQQSQKQTQHVVVNVGQTTSSAKATGESVTLSDEDAEV